MAERSSILGKFLVPSRQVPTTKHSLKISEDEEVSKRSFLKTCYRTHRNKQRVFRISQR